MVMKRTLLHIFFLICLVGFNLSCKKEIQQETIKPEPKEITEQVPSKKVEIVEPKAWDSINQKNAVDFLIAYGENHKENKLRVKTRLGNMIVKLYDDTPLHRASFLFLINSLV